MITFLLSSLRRYLQQRLVFRWSLLFELLGTTTLLLIFFLIDRYQGKFFDARLTTELAQLKTSYFGYVALGIAVSELSSLGLGGVLNQVHEEKSNQTFEYLMSSPVSMRLWSLATGLVNLVRSLGQFILVFGIAILILRLEVPRFSGATAMLVLLAASVPLWCLALLTLATSLVFRRGNPLLLVLGIGFELLGGVYVPKAVLPHWLGQLGELLPITPAVRAMQHVVYSGAGLPEIAGDLAQLAVLTAVYLPLALITLKKSDEYARRHGYYCLS